MVNFQGKKKQPLNRTIYPSYPIKKVKKQKTSYSSAVSDSKLAKFACGKVTSLIPFVLNFC
jgi:hypothetical protein